MGKREPEGHPYPIGFIQVFKRKGFSEKGGEQNRGKLHFQGFFRKGTRIDPYNLFEQEIIDKRSRVLRPIGPGIVKSQAAHRYSKEGNDQNNHYPLCKLFFLHFDLLPFIPTLSLEEHILCHRGWKGKPFIHIA